MLRTPIVLGLVLLVAGLVCLAATVYQVKVGETDYHMSPVTEEYEWRSRNFAVTIIGIEFMVVGVAVLLYYFFAVFLLRNHSENKKEIASHEEN